MSQASHHSASATSLHRTTQSPDIPTPDSASHSARDLPSQIDKSSAKLAHQSWEERRRPERSLDDHWFRAERQFLG